MITTPRMADFVTTGKSPLTTPRTALRIVWIVPPILWIYLAIAAWQAWS